MPGTIIGIDTGGTYTDAVVCDAVSHEIYASAKALTTHGDLAVGIHNALASLPSGFLKQAEAVSLSTTLATNACLENKGCRALLILFGTEMPTVRKYGLKHGHFDAEDVWCIETATHPDGTIDRMPDWNAFAEEFKERSAGYEAFAVAEIYASKTCAVLERKACGIISEITSAPVVCGHELFSELNVLKRGANALLNARLIPIIREFLSAIDRSLKELHIDAPVMIVRSDGTLMSASYAVTHPIETLLCGPAASALGACALTGLDKAVVADIGGTTSDMAFLNGREPEEVNGTVRIGEWNTFLHGLFIETFALGGDTGVSYTPFRGTAADPDIPEKPAVPSLGKRRLIPTCVLASDCPEVMPELRSLSSLPDYRLKDASWYEYYVFQHDLPAADYTKREELALSFLRERPLTIRQLLARMQVKNVGFSPRRLVSLGVLLKSGLTPTDVLHVQGIFTKYNTEASEIILDFAASAMRMKRDELCAEILSMAEFRLYKNVAMLLLEKNYPEVRSGKLDTKLLERILEERWKIELAQKQESPLPKPLSADHQDPGQSSSEAGPGFLSFPIHTSTPLIGIGGPAYFLMPPVAAALHTTCFIPKHAEVANALGAALGHIAFQVNVDVTYLYELSEEEKASQKDVTKPAGFHVLGKGISRRFAASEEAAAIAFAKEAARDLALAEAKERGLKGLPDIKEYTRKEYLVEPSMPGCIKVTLVVHD
ncbi:MAG: hydantoinase/oxoprolinase family protein [Lachnospiraceae bacterium]|nr:hydantoinase/oxoprolinase family protein [Lachnospiraceae bacterium]